MFLPGAPSINPETLSDLHHLNILIYVVLVLILLSSILALFPSKPLMGFSAATINATSFALAFVVCLETADGMAKITTAINENQGGEGHATVGWAWLPFAVEIVVQPIATMLLFVSWARREVARLERRKQLRDTEKIARESDAGKQGKKAGVESATSPSGRTKAEESTSTANEKKVGHDEEKGLGS
jgi:hypothetical protein